MFISVPLTGTVMQIEKVLINDRLRVSKVSIKFRISPIRNFAVNSLVKFAILLKSSLLFNSFCCFFLFKNKTLRLNNFPSFPLL